MKTKTLARRIASVVLAMMIVLSFALVSVSALPADLSVVDSKREVINFDDGVTKGGLGASTEATSFTIVPESETDPVHSGTHSLKIVGKSGYARIKYQGITFEPNSTYHVSFWYYSPTWTNNNGGAGANANPGGSTRGTVSHSGYTTNQWNKIWFDITTSASVTSQNFTFCFWGVSDTTSLYIDDFEVAKVGASSASHTVPAGMTAEKTISKSFEELTATSMYGYATSTGFTTMATNTTTPVSAENAHWGEVSLKLQNNGEATKDYGMYVNIRDNQAFGATGMTLEANANYYFSYWVYSPDKDGVSVASYLIDATRTAPITAIPRGVWTKVQGVFTASETTASNANAHLMRLISTNAENAAVYYDDFVFAKLTEMPAATTLTAGDVDYDFAANTATVEISSTWELASVATANITAPEGITVTSANLSADKKTITVGLSGVALDGNYTLTATGLTDAFGRAVEDASVAVAMPTAAQAPMTISSSSVVDGATDIAPVKELYFKVPYAVDEATVIASNFSITGYGASIVGVEKVADTEIKVTLDGIFPAETYVLSVDGVANTSGGVLKDRITFTTKAAEYSYNVDFEDEAFPSKYVEFSAGSECGGCELSAEKAYNGSNQSLKLTAQNQYGGFAKVRFAKLKKGVPYVISFWYYSDTWSGSTANSQYGTYSNWVFSDTTKGQWNKVQVTFTSDYNGSNISFWGLGNDGVIYIDNLEVKEAATAYQPVVKANGEYVQSLAEGENTVEFKVDGSTAGRTVTAFVITYDENNKMLSAIPVTKTVAAKATETFTLTVTKAAGVTTKVIVMDANTYAPLYDVIQ